jgi:hypothetical protein
VNPFGRPGKILEDKIMPRYISDEEYKECLDLREVWFASAIVLLTLITIFASIFTYVLLDYNKFHWTGVTIVIFILGGCFAIYKLTTTNNIIKLYREQRPENTSGDKTNAPRMDHNRKDWR